MTVGWIRVTVHAAQINRDADGSFLAPAEQSNTVASRGVAPRTTGECHVGAALLQHVPDMNSCVWSGVMVRIAKAPMQSSGSLAAIAVLSCPAPLHHFFMKRTGILQTDLS